MPSIAELMDKFADYPTDLKNPIFKDGEPDEYEDYIPTERVGKARGEKSTHNKKSRGNGSGGILSRDQAEHRAGLTREFVEEHSRQPNLTELSEMTSEALGIETPEKIIERDLAGFNRAKTDEYIDWVLAGAKGEITIANDGLSIKPEETKGIGSVENYILGDSLTGMRIRIKADEVVSVLGQEISPERYVSHIREQLVSHIETWKKILKDIPEEEREQKILLMLNGLRTNQLPPTYTGGML